MSRTPFKVENAKYIVVFPSPFSGNANIRRVRTRAEVLVLLYELLDISGLSAEDIEIYDIADAQCYDPKSTWTKLRPEELSSIHAAKQEFGSVKE